MSRLRAEGEFEVPLGPCRCDADHDTDTAWLPNSLDPFDAVEAMSVVLSGDSEATIQRGLSLIFLRRGRWDLIADGQPLPWEPERFDWATVSPIANAAAERYTSELLDPFQEGLPKSSQPTPTEASTSPSPQSGQGSP